MMIARVAGQQMARVIGYAAVPVLIAPILGPVVAGAILQHTSWRWLFLVNLPVGALALALAVWFLPGDRDETQRRELDWAGLALLSPALVLFLYGAERIDAVPGIGAIAVSALLLATFLRVERRKGERALIDLALFRSRVFGAAAATQFLSNGAIYAGQMLIPVFLIEACGRSPGEMGWLLAPLGLGMLVTYPSMGALTSRFGVRRLAAAGALLALAATLPFVYLALAGYDPYVLVPALFLRGMGQSAIGAPSISAAYASVERHNLPMATTSLNIVQRLGGPTFTTMCTLLLAWRLQAASVPAGGTQGAAYAWAFGLLCALHAASFVTTLRLPTWSSGAGGRTAKAMRAGSR
jgi:MFS family permease